jgi:uncharacterized membrane protein
LLVSLGVGLLCALGLTDSVVSAPVTRALIGWNVAAVLYLVLALHMMFRSSHARMRERALLEDEGSKVILVLVIVAALACVGAIVAELSLVKVLHSDLRFAHIGLTVLTLASSWAFTQTMFALHYAHDYYATATHGAHGGLDFPGNEPPDYGDFLYFALVIGTSAQTADVGISRRPMRRTVMVHCVLAFFFNTTLLALAINIASGYTGLATGT